MDETTASLPLGPMSRQEGDSVLALAIAWSSDPERTGEVALFPRDDRETRVLGRGETEGPRVIFHRQRPGSITAEKPLEGAALSRRQLTFRVRPEGLHVERVGRCPMRVNGNELDRALVVPGDVVTCVGQLVLVCITRPSGALPACEFFPRSAMPAFGKADELGIVGESQETWALRDRLAFAGTLDGHVLVVGESGSGKELAARAVHMLSHRRSKRFLARNAATLPPGLVDAELFGNVKNYPNPGMPERPGLVGEADGGTLFLDEVGELPQELQAHLLRMLDRGGEYQRLGEAKTLRANVRFVGATNRSMDTLKHDLLARFSVRVEVPPLSLRREDVPLLARHLVAKLEAENPALAKRIAAKPLSAALVEDLVRRDPPGNVRGIETMIVESFAPRGPRAADPTPPPRAVAPPPVPSAVVPTEEEVRAAIAKHGREGREASRALGLGSRYDLLRLMKRYGIEP